METALCLLYLIMGCWSIGYIKHDFLGWTTFTVIIFQIWHWDFVLAS